MQDIRLTALQHTQFTPFKPSSVISSRDASTTGFDADHAHRFVFQKIEAEPDRVGAAAHTGDHLVRQTAFAFEQLFLRLLPNHAVEIAHHHRIRVRAQGGSQNIMRGTDIRHPVAHGFVDRFLEGFLAGFDADTLSPHQPHPKYVQGLALHIHGAHVNAAFETKLRADCGRGHTMLTRPGFGDDPFFAHAFRQQHLANRVVDFMGSRVDQVLAFEINFSAPAILGQTFRKIQLGRPPREFLQMTTQFRQIRLIFTGFLVDLAQFLQRGHERLRHKHTPVISEVTAVVGQGKTI